MILTILNGSGDRRLGLAGTVAAADLPVELRPLEDLQSEFDRMLREGFFAVASYEKGGAVKPTDSLDPQAYEITVWRQGYGG